LFPDWEKVHAWHRGGHLGGNRGHCESKALLKWLLDTGHGSHSRDNVDFGLRQNAKIMVRTGLRWANQLTPTKVGAVSALSSDHPATHNRANNQDDWRSPQSSAARVMGREGGG
jgi:hypothetical protein